MLYCHLKLPTAQRSCFFHTDKNYTGPILQSGIAHSRRSETHLVGLRCRNAVQYCTCGQRPTPLASEAQMLYSTALYMRTESLLSPQRTLHRCLPKGTECRQPLRQQSAAWRARLSTRPESWPCGSASDEFRLITCLQSFPCIQVWR